MKDVPTDLPAGLEIVASRGAKTRATPPVLPEQALRGPAAGCELGTSALRRQTQLLTVRPDLKVESLRGNLHTRIGKLQEGRTTRSSLPPPACTAWAWTIRSPTIPGDPVAPAIGQGALGIENLAPTPHVGRRRLPDPPRHRRCRARRARAPEALRGRLPGAHRRLRAHGGGRDRPRRDGGAPRRVAGSIRGNRAGTVSDPESLGVALAEISCRRAGRSWTRCTRPPGVDGPGGSGAGHGPGGEALLVTRGGGQADELSALIRERGGVPVLFPTIRIVPVDDPAPLDAAIRDLPSFDWVLFTSANAARFFCERAEALGASRTARRRPGRERRTGDRGRARPAWESRLHLHGGAAHGRRARGGPRAGTGRAGRRFLLPRALEGRDVNPGGDRAAGGDRDGGGGLSGPGLPAKRPAGPRRRSPRRAPPDVCTFASPSAFRNFFRLLGEETAASILTRSLIAVIGEVTARAVAGRNLAVDIMPEKYTLMGMIEAIEARLRRA